MIFIFLYTYEVAKAVQTFILMVAFKHSIYHVALRLTMNKLYFGTLHKIISTVPIISNKTLQSTEPH